MLCSPHPPGISQVLAVFSLSRALSLSHTRRPRLSRSLTSFQQIVDHIYEKVDHLEPWSAGTARVPSTAFCLLFKLATMGVTRNQMVAMLNHADSPYIRGVGFLFLRFTAPPKDLWTWYEPYIDDLEEFSADAAGSMT